MNRNPIDDPNTGAWSDERMSRLHPHNSWEPDLQRGLTLLHSHRRANRKSKSLWIAAGAFATCLSLMATPASRAFAERCLSACVAFGAAPNTPAEVHRTADDRTLAPDFALNNLSGSRVRLSDFRGKVVLLNFWATWCAPCRAEIPAFVRFQNAYRNRGFTVVGVSLDEPGSTAVKQFAEAEHMNYPVLVGDNKIADLFGGLKAVPTSFIIDRRGRIAAVHMGICQPSEYQAEIRAALSE